MGTPIRPEVPLSPAEQLRRAQEQRTLPQVTPAERLRQAHDLSRLSDQSTANRVLRIQGQTAFPADFVERNLDSLEKQVSEPDFDADRFWRESPNVAQWLAEEPARVGATGRDIQRMGRVERYLKAIGTEFERNRITTQLTDPVLAAMRGTATPEQEETIARLRARQAALPNLGPEGFLAGIPVATIGQLPVLFDLYKGGVAGGAVGAAVGAGTAAVAGQLGPQVAVPEEILTVPGMAARGFYLGSRAGVAVEGMKLSAAEAFLEFRDIEGVSREDAAIGAAITGVVAGALEVIPFGEAAKRLPGLRRLGKEGVRGLLAAPNTRALLRNVAGHIVAQGFAEGGTEGAQALIQHIGSVLTERAGNGTLGDVDATTLLREMFGDAEAWREVGQNIRAGAQAGAGFGAGGSAATAAVDYPAVKRAEQNAARARAAAEAIHGNDREQAMAMVKDAPESMRQAVASMNADGGYYDVSAWSAYWQSQEAANGEKADPRQVAMALGVSAEEYDAALATKATINIPADRLLVDAMGSTHRDWLVDNLRSTPNELSKAEATEQRKMDVEEVADVGEAVPRETEADDAVTAFAERLTEQLRGAKMVAGDVEQNVTLWTEAARTAIARNPDVPVADVMRRFEQVQVTALPVAVDASGRAVSLYEVTNETMARPDGVQVPVLRATKSAQKQMARAERRLVERYGGDESKMPERERAELTAARQAFVDAEAVNQQLVPFPTIAELQGLRQSAVPAIGEAFTAEERQAMEAETRRTRELVSRTWRMLDKEGRLTPEQRAQYAVYLNADVLEQAATHGFTESQGALPETIDVGGVQRPTRNSNGQPIHPTEQGVRNFWAWFGDSKVVDAEGRPLVVYHGTSAQFDVFDIGKLSSRNEGPGFYFTTSEAIAGGYVNRSGSEGRLIAAYLRADSPLQYSAKPLKAGKLQTLVKRIAKLESDGEAIDARDGFLANFGDTYGGGIDGAARQAATLIANDESAVDQISGIVGSGVSAEYVLSAFTETTGHDSIVARGFSDEGDASNTIYVVFRSEQVKDLGNDGTFGPTANILRQGGAEPRGAFIAGPERTESGARIDGPRLIAMFKERNQSTFLHESAHAFLDIWQGLADDPRTSPEFRQMVAEFKTELGAEPSAVLTEAQEEAFAGMFLDYAKSGKAPSQALRVAFASFAKWLTRLWSLLKGEIVPASPKVRDLLDRMLATDEAIAEAQGLFMAPLFPQDAAINEAFVKARTKAEEQTRAEAMLTIRRAEAEWWKRESEKVREEVTANVQQDPAYIARQALTALENADGTALARDNPLRQKVNREQVVAVLGPEATKALPRGKAGAIYSTNGGGMDLALAAQALGYDNGSALLEAIAATQPMEQHIESVTDATMRERYGDPMTDGSIPEVAIEALHNDALDRMRQLEVEAILRDHPEAFRDAVIRAAARPLNFRELQAWAKESIQGRVLNKLRPTEYLTAERKAQREAVVAVTEARWADAVQAKNRQRLAAALYAEAIAVKQEMEKAKTLFAKVWGPDEAIAKRRNFDIVQAARSILANYGVGQRQEQTAAYLQQLAEYDPQTAQDLTPLITETLALVPPRDKFSLLTVSEAQFVHETVAALWQQSRDAEMVTIDGKKVALTDAIQPMVEVMQAKPDAMKGAGVERRTEWTDTANRGLLTAKAALRRVESWVDVMDGGDINGPFRRALFTRIREATATKNQRNREFLTAYEGLLEKVRPFLGNAEIPAKELGSGQWVWKDTAHLLGAMLHTGNPSNFTRLLDGRNWTSDQWMTMRDRLIADGTLRPEHFAFVQGVWDLFEAMKPEAQQVHRRMFGRYFAEITREAFTINWPDGTSTTYDGGYTPASKDPDASGLAAKRQAESFLEEAYGMRFPTVTRGFALNRVQNREPLLLSLDIVTKHIDAVQKFVHLAEPVREVGRILRNRTFREAFDGVDPTLINEMLLPWLERTSTQRVEKPWNKYVDAMARYVRTTAGAAFMFANVRNTLEQVSGFSTAALRVDPKYLSLAVANQTQDPQAITNLIQQHSPFMADLVMTSVMDVSRRVDKIVTQPNVFQSTAAFAQEHAYVLQITMQEQINRTVWYGSYLESTDRDLSVAEAVRKADADVRLTQGSFEAVDVSRIETGTPLWRAVAMFAGYFNMLANLNATEMQKAVETMGLKKSMPKMLHVYALGFAVPILFSGLLRQAFRGFADVDGDDEWGYLDDFLAFFFGEQARAATAMVPAGGQSVQYLVNLFDEQPFNDRISVSPALSFLEGAGRGVKAQYDVLAGDGLQRRDIRDVLSFYSLMTRVPVTGIAPPLTYLYDVEQGRARPSGPVDFTRGLLSGQP